MSCELGAVAWIYCTCGYSFVDDCSSTTVYFGLGDLHDAWILADFTHIIYHHLSQQGKHHNHNLPMACLHSTTYITFPLQFLVNNKYESHDHAVFDFVVQWLRYQVSNVSDTPRVDTSIASPVLTSNNNQLLKLVLSFPIENVREH